MRYAHYKDSGIEWIGEIPQGWSISKIKHCCSIYTGNSISDDEKNNYVYKDNSIPYIATKDIEAETNKINYDNGLYIPIDSKTFNIAPKNSILLCIEGGSAGRKISYTEQDVCFVNKLCCFNHNKLNNSKFLYYILQSDMFLTDFNLKMTGLIGGVSQSAIKNIILAIPKFEEQRQIADYLDKKCEKIDRVIEIQKSIIERLKEYKQSVITEAVTKGLDKSVPLKDSGIEWIGEIPQEWKLEKLKNLFIFCKGLSITKDNLISDGIAVISYGQIHSKFNTGTHISNDLIRFVSDSYLEENNLQSLVNRGDFIFADTSEDIEGAGNYVFIDKEMILFAGYHSIILKNKFKNFILGRYLSYLFQAIQWRAQIRARVNGIKVYSISQKILKEITIIMPNQSEQQQIANYLDKKCAQIDKTIADKELMIEKLIEYKKSLIYECVTGKRKVV